MEPYKNVEKKCIYLVIKNYDSANKKHDNELRTLCKPNKNGILSLKIGTKLERISKKVDWWFKARIINEAEVKLEDDIKLIGYVPSIVLVPIIEETNINDNSLDKKDNTIPIISDTERKYFPCIHEYYKNYVKKEPCLHERANWFDRQVYHWFNKIAYVGFNRTLIHDDFWERETKSNAENLLKAFDNIRKTKEDKIVSVKKMIKMLPYELNKTTDSLEPSIVFSSKKKYSLAKTIFIMFRKEFISGFISKILQDGIKFLIPLLISYILAYVEKPMNNWFGYVLVIILFIVSCANSFLLNKYFETLTIIGINIKSVLITLLYRKMLHLNSISTSSYTSVDQVNMVSIDATRLQDLCENINMLWSAPLQIIASIIYLYMTLGVASLAAIAVMVGVMPFNFLLGMAVKKMQIKQMKLKDRRVRLMDEVIGGIKLIKLYSWEEAMKRDIMILRDLELKNNRKVSLVRSVLWIFMVLTPTLVSLSCFGTYIALGNTLTASVAFVSLSILNILRYPFTILADAVNSFISASVSYKRITAYLDLEEIDNTFISKNSSNNDSNDFSISIKEGEFAWELNRPPVLENININIKKNSLVAIVGTIGSGKSSLMQAILGELLIKKGNITINGKIAYVSQIPWIQNMSMKDNILYGEEFDQFRYENTVKGCSLDKDIEILSAKDDTEIGEKGVNLSGGQKQRVNMARAVYSNNDIFMFDDPLSAVDSNVGQHLFKVVISNQGMLKDKTRILITHKLDTLPYVDSIIVLDKGKIIHYGSYQELKDKGVNFLEFIERKEKNPNLSEHVENDKKIDEVLKQTSQDPNNPLTGKIIKQDVISEGAVLGSIYHKYFKSMKYEIILVSVLFSILCAGGNLGSQLWLADFSTRGIDVNETGIFLGGYGGFTIGSSLAQALSGVILVLGSYYASRNLHNSALRSIMLAPMEFFETTPAGRILNIFSQDINVIDEKIGPTFQFFQIMLFNSIITLAGIFKVIPYFVIPVVIMSIFYMFVQEIFVRTSRQLKRLQASSTAPVLTHILETAHGSEVIRAYEKQDSFNKRLYKLVNENLTEYSAIIYSNRWLSIRLELIANLMTLFASGFSVLSALTTNLGSGQVGFVINSITSITQLFNFLIRMRSEMETNLVSVERVDAYMNLKKEKQNIGPPCIIPMNWPNSGKIEFIDYSTKYREELELSLNKISIVINSGEKVGVVGRTGSGKSTMLLALFRILEANGGKILIDDVDVTSFSLNELREALTIIPQDTFLFKGTLRHNIDPINIHSDADIWHAIDSAHLRGVTDIHTEGLDFELSEGGDNLSAGERQLVCLTRAILKHSKVLILDEATASIDLETDKLIQATIRTVFKDCTILTVAHRLETILDYDKILVLDHGQIMEFDTPEKLLQGNSYFKKLCDDSKYSS